MIYLQKILTVGLLVVMSSNITPAQELLNSTITSTAEFIPQQIDVLEGFSVELIAGPPLVDHPTFATFDDQGRLYVCNNAGVNLSATDLEAQLPNSIKLLEDIDGDGK